MIPQGAQPHHEQISLRTGAAAAAAETWVPQGRWETAAGGRRGRGLTPVGFALALLGARGLQAPHHLRDAVPGLRAVLLQLEAQVIEVGRRRRCHQRAPLGRQVSQRRIQLHHLRSRRQPCTPPAPSRTSRHPGSSVRAAVWMLHEPLLAGMEPESPIASQFLKSLGLIFIQASCSLTSSQRIASRAAC